MAESKRDYYEVLGVPKDADDAALKKAYRVLAKNIIRMQTPETRKPKPNSRKHRKPTAYSAIRRKEDSMTSSVMLHLKAAQEEAASAALISQVPIWAIFSAIFSVIFLADAEAAREATAHAGSQSENRNQNYV